MNLWLRLIWLMSSAWRRAPLHPLNGMSRLPFRVMPHDLDTSLHMNNGRYLALMDLGRTDWLIRTRLWRGVMRHGWTPILAATQVRFRRELRLFQRFHVETRLVCWDQTQAVMEQRIMTRGKAGGEVISAIALMLVGLYDRKARGFVPMERLIAETGIVVVSPPVPAIVATFLESQKALQDSLRRAA